MGKTVKQLEEELKAEQDNNKVLNEQVVELKNENQDYKTSNENLMLEGEKLSEENAILSKALSKDEKKEVVIEKKEIASFDVEKAVAEYFTANPTEKLCHSTKTRLFGASNKALAIAGAGGKKGVKTHLNPNK